MCAFSTSLIACSTYSSLAVPKHHVQKDLLVSLVRLTVPGESIIVTEASQQSEEQEFWRIHLQRQTHTERENWNWGEIMNSQSPPSEIDFCQEGHILLKVP